MSLAIPGRRKRKEEGTETFDEIQAAAAAKEAKSLPSSYSRYRAAEENTPYTYFYFQGSNKMFFLFLYGGSRMRTRTREKKGFPYCLWMRGKEGPVA